LIITDTGGQEKYKDSVTNTVKQSEGIIYVFSLDNQELLKFLKENMRLHRSKFHLNVPFVVAANKCDLSKDMKKVRIEQAKKELKLLPNEDIIETSAKTIKNVKNLFSLLIKKLNQKKT
jgi:GTPase KRas protein